MKLCMILDISREVSAIILTAVSEQWLIVIVPRSTFWSSRLRICGLRDHPDLRPSDGLFSQDHDRDLAGPWNTVGKTLCYFSHSTSQPCQ